MHFTWYQLPSKISSRENFEAKDISSVDVMNNFSFYLSFICLTKSKSSDIQARQNIEKNLSLYMVNYPMTIKTLIMKYSTIIKALIVIGDWRFSCWYRFLFSWVMTHPQGHEKIVRENSGYEGGHEAMILSLILAA